MIGAGIVSFLIFIVVSLSLKDTQTIWHMTRILGLMSFLFLFLTVLIGELRLIYLEKSDFSLFRFHKPAAIIALSLVMTHFITALFDNYKWGKSLAFIQYLGFSFSDKWLVALSLGTLAFYIMAIVAVTSAKKSIQFIKFKRWKILHYLSYASFIIAYIHSINLGTDLKDGSLAGFFLLPSFIAALLIVTSVLIIRILKGFGLFHRQITINLSAVSIFIVIISAVFISNGLSDKQSEKIEISKKILIEQKIIDYYSQELDNISKTNDLLTGQIVRVKNETYH